MDRATHKRASRAKISDFYPKFRSQIPYISIEELLRALLTPCLTKRPEGQLNFHSKLPLFLLEAKSILTNMPRSIHSMRKLVGDSGYLRGHPPRVTSSKRQLGVNPPSAQDPSNSLTNTKLSQTP